MQWAAEFDTTVTSTALNSNYGSGAVDDVKEMNSKLYSALRSTTEGTPFVVDNAESGNGLDAWRFTPPQVRPRSCNV